MSVLLPAVAMPAWCATPTPAITASFASFWTAAQGQPFAQQLQAWDRAVEDPQRSLYASVVWETALHPDWRQTRQRLLQQRFAEYPGIARGLPAEAAALQHMLEQTLPRFRQWFPDADAKPPVYLLLAPNFDAKSGVLADGSPVLAFAVDSLALEQAQLDIVVPHELFHLYHARHRGFRNDGVMPDVPLTIPLFEEGLATYVSSQLSSGHDDGELLLQAELGTLPASRLPEIARRFLADARAQAIDPAHPEVFKRWFNAARQPYQQGLPNRSGYWLGLQVIRYLRRHNSLARIAAWTPAQADTQVMAALRSLAAADASG
ncbi:hypothetical protein [Dyella acidiphila]|uniref:DUF2268 domain-containing protein n=1 Tax=Dyella acidiphila TaxID=2775866 RepID=A0ABR9G604_9GAMM|nr:hypothetical protein [Dyella acidiphila]MBE1159447.1 hypothetical protein [Dyella acidiphila]